MRCIMQASARTFHIGQQICRFASTSSTLMTPGADLMDERVRNYWEERFACVLLCPPADTDMNLACNHEQTVTFDVIVSTGNQSILELLGTCRSWSFRTKISPPLS